MDQDWKNNVDTKLDKIVELNSNQDISLAKLTSIAATNSKILEEHQKVSSGNSTRLKYLEDENIKYRNYIKGCINGIKWIVRIVIGAVGFISLILNILKLLHLQPIDFGQYFPQKHLFIYTRNQTKYS